MLAEIIPRDCWPRLIAETTGLDCRPILPTEIAKIAQIAEIAKVAEIASQEGRSSLPRLSAEIAGRGCRLRLLVEIAGHEGRDYGGCREG